MNAFKDVEPVTELKKNAAGLIERTRQQRGPILITQNGKATAVLQDVASYERQRQALLLLKLVTQGEQAYRDGKTQSHDNVMRRVSDRLDELE